jgi:hypothetical protein
MRVFKQNCVRPAYAFGSSCCSYPLGVSGQIA